MVFLDNAGTTQADKDCLDIIKKYSFESFYNPSALYCKSVGVNNDIKQAKKSILNNLYGDGKLVFTSSGTESNNLALLGCSKRKGARIIISESEHPAVFNTAMHLAQCGYDIAIAEVDYCGRVIFDKYTELVTENTALISIMHVNNELGGINDIKKLADYAKKINKNIVFHSDGVQALGKIAINLEELGVDLYTLSSHKIHSIKGCGGLFVKNNINIQPILFGGGQEGGLRSSTENTSAIMCLKHMLDKQVANLKNNLNKVVTLKNYLCNNLSNNDNLTILSDNLCSPYIVALALKAVRGEVMLHALESHNIMIGTGSACNSSKLKPKENWKTKNLRNQYKNGLIRVSFNHNNTIEEIEYFVNKLNLEYSNLIKYAKG